MKIRYGGMGLDIDVEWSNRDFTGKTGMRVPDGANVYCSCFSQESPDTEVFATDLTATFYNCNLDNVLVPPSCTVIGGSNTRFKVQNDLRDWEIDADNKPVVVTNEKYWKMVGVPVDPKLIPTEKAATLDEAVAVMTESVSVAVGGVK